MSKLHDPDLPAGAIVATHEDDESLEEGQVRRNDGSVLNPASKNPWYVLATVAGEQENFSIDEELHAKNRRFWNGWMCKDLSNEQRERLAEKLELKIEELGPLSEYEKRRLDKRFAKTFSHLGQNDHLPDPATSVDMSEVYFLKSSAFGKYYFPKNSYFETVCFSAITDFESANFAGAVFFGDSHFADIAFFCNANFNGPAEFENAEFSKYGNFRSAQFFEYSSFRSSHFAEGAYFQIAYFFAGAYFQNAHFGWHADFSNGSFTSKTVFNDATFEARVPEFFHREMHQDTSFTDDPTFWPEVTDDNAEHGKRAYTRLRQIAAEIYDPDLEHFFLRQEMRCKEMIERKKGDWYHAWAFAAYRVIADSGVSVVRPALGLLGCWLVPALVYLMSLGGKIMEGSVTLSMFGPFGLSFANLFAFLGLNRLYFREVIEAFGPWLSLLAGAQTVAGVILLFFLGLGLRNRFRLK